MLTIKNVTKFFNNKKILNNVSLHVKKGEIALFLGSSGVGKSTLLRIMNNLETIDSGTLALNDKELNLEVINKTHLIGMVFQHFNLFEHLTVEKNITLPLEKILKYTHEQSHKVAENLLTLYGLFDKKNTYARRLSGGQKQRLAIARAIAMKPEIICLDEPTSALDPILTSHVANTIQQLAADGLIVLVASHDISLIKKLNCTIYFMSNGSIVETASSQEFNNNEAQFPLIKKFVDGQA